MAARRVGHRRNLVIVRAGDSSLHPGWLHCRKPRNWDLLISYFGENADAFRSSGVSRVDGKGPKWPILKAVIAERADEIIRYEYVFLPDDDLECDGDSITQLFEVCKQVGLALAQPSLSLDSFASHGITLHNKSSVVRFTNYVEIMAPCFHQTALRLCLDTFDENITGWGIDILWAALIAEQGWRLGIVDDVQVRHTRSFFGPNYEHLRTIGKSPGDEASALLAKYSLKQPLLRNVGIVDHSGNERTIAVDSECSEEWVTVPWAKFV